MKYYENYKSPQGLFQKFLPVYELTVQIVASLGSEVNLAIGFVLITFLGISMKI